MPNDQALGNDLVWCSGRSDLRELCAGCARFSAGATMTLIAEMEVVQLVDGSCEFRIPVLHPQETSVVSLHSTSHETTIPPP